MSASTKSGAPVASITWQHVPRADGVRNNRTRSFAVRLCQANGFPCLSNASEDIGSSEDAVSAVCSADGAGVGRRSSPPSVIRSSPYTYQGGREALRYRESIRFLARLVCARRVANFALELGPGTSASAQRGIARGRLLWSARGADVSRINRGEIELRGSTRSARGSR